MVKKGVLLLYRLKMTFFRVKQCTRPNTNYGQASEREMIEVPIVIGSIASCKVIQDSPGF